MQHPWNRHAEQSENDDVEKGGALQGYGIVFPRMYPKK